jgi:hypothetical protein
MRRLGIWCGLAMALLMAGFSLGNASTAMNMLLTATVTNTYTPHPQVFPMSDFRAYFLAVERGWTIESGSSLGFSELSNFLNAYGWGTAQITTSELQTLVDLDADQTAISVLIIPSGTEPLDNDSLSLIADYVNRGGNLIMFASTQFNDPVLATADNMFGFLYSTFGIYFLREMAIDPSPRIDFTLLSSNYDSEHFIINNVPYDEPRDENGDLSYRSPHPIIISELLPPNVAVTPIAWSDDDAYVRSLEEIQNRAYEQEEGDIYGTLTLIAASENSATGSRAVFFSDDEFGTNGTLAYRERLASRPALWNFDVAFNAILWAARFDPHNPNANPTLIPQATSTSRVSQEDIYQTATAISSFSSPTFTLSLGDIQQTATELAVTFSSNLMTTTSSPYPFQLAAPVTFMANFANPTAGCNWQGIGGRVRGLDGIELEAGRLNVMVFDVDNTFSQTVPIGRNTNYGVLSGWEVRTGDSANEGAYFVTLLTPSSTQVSERIQVSFPGNCNQNLAYLDFVRVR